MHVAYLVPENQIKRKDEYRNTQQVQYETTRTLTRDEQTLEFHSEIEI
jgi:hypothetical protein